MTRPPSSLSAWALDFDGVIADSVLECLAAGYQAWQILNGNDRPAVPSLLPGPVLRSARRLRPFIRSGEDYVYLFHAVSENRSLLDQDAFDTFKETHQDRFDTYFQAFYEERSRMRRETPEQWIGLNPLYPGMARALKKRDGDFDIISTKQSDYIETILQAHHIPFSRQRIFYASPGRSKFHILTRMLRKRKNGHALPAFVDDQVDTLLKCLPLGIPLFLAGWGYNTEAQKQTAQESGIPVLALDAFLAGFQARP